MRSRAILAVVSILLSSCGGDVLDSPRAVGELRSNNASGRGGGASATSFATITTLPTLSGGSGEALAVNRAGTVITGHSSERRGTTRAVRWVLQENGVWTVEALPLSPAATGAIARGVNDAGDAAGNDFPASAPHVVVWPSAGGFNFPGCGELGEGYAISAAGQVIVGAQRVVQPATAEVWSPGSCRVDLPSLTSGGWASADAVNGDGTIVGGVSSPTASGSALPVRWSFVNQAWQIGQLDQRSGDVRGANAAGDLAGNVIVSCADPAGCNRATIWYAAGGSRELGTLGGSVSWARGINGSGEVAGSSSPSAQGNATAFFWSEASGMVQLPFSGKWAAANAISDIRADGTRLVVGMSSRTQPIVWIVRNP